MRALDRVKADYATHSYGDGEAVSGVEVAHMLGQDERRVFKTLVTEGKSRAHYVFMVPVAEELDLKKAAACVGEKALSMLKSKELLPLTGYVHGGCSPIGMKKPFRIVAHENGKELRYHTLQRRQDRPADRNQPGKPAKSRARRAGGHHRIVKRGALNPTAGA